MNQEIQQISIQQDCNRMNLRSQMHTDQMEALGGQQYLIQKLPLGSSNEWSQNGEGKGQKDSSNDLVGQHCLICLNEFQDPEMQAIPSCGHRFCKSCLNAHIRTNIQQCKIANCPFEECSQPINYSQQFFKYITPNQRKRYARNQRYLQLINSDESRICPRQVCDGTFSIKFNPSNCNKCNQKYCSICYHKFHQGNCDENGINFLIENYKYQQCSICKMVLQKNDGCPHMVCRCGYQFCYICGCNWIDPHHCYGTTINVFMQNTNIENNYIEPTISYIDQVSNSPITGFTRFLVLSYSLIVVIMILCLPFDIILFVIKRIIDGLIEMVRMYKWYQILMGNIILLMICIIKRGCNEIYYWRCEQIVRFLQPLSYKIIMTYIRAIKPDI